MMETNTSSQRAGGEPLRRPLDGRVVAGVAQGLALRLGLPPWAVRLAFVLLALTGGFGVALYLAAWLLIPEEGRDRPIAADLLSRVDSGAGWIGVALIAIAVIVVAEEIRFFRGDLVAAAVLLVVGVLLYRGDLGRRGPRPDGGNEEPAPPPLGATPASYEPGDTVAMPPPPQGQAAPPRPRERSQLGRLTLGIGVLALGVMALADSLSPAFDPRARHYLGLAVGVIGLGLLVGSILGRARWLIVLGALLVPLLLLSPLADLDFPVSVGQRVHSPDDITELEDSYRLGVGELVLDLSDLDLEGGTATVDAEVGIGQLTIHLPDGAAVEVDARTAVGAVALLGFERGGLGVSQSGSIPGAGGTLILDAQVDMGQVTVARGDRSRGLDLEGGLR